MKKYLVLASMLLALPAAAQDVYKVEAFSGSDLNGTARYVGMGGAMNALGADLSTMNTNPAGIGMYRRGDISMSGSLLIQPGAETLADIGKTRASFDQMGVAFAMPLNGKHLKFLNFGFNYQKKRNFKNYIGLDQIATNGQSQSWQMADLGNFFGIDAQYNTLFSPIAEVGYEAGLIGEVDEDETGWLYPYDAQSYSYYRVQHGGIKEYDFNVSMNFDNRWYFGLTLGAYDVDWRSYLVYGEALTSGNDYGLWNDEYISGTGFDVKLGTILRPVADSPFRIGLAISTPTWFNLTGNNVLGFRYFNGEFYTELDDFCTGDFDYRITTPWKFNLSLATTVGKNIALDAEYELQDYKSASVRYPDNDGYWDDWGYGGTYKDETLAKEIDNNLNVVHTLRIGAEAKLTDGLYGRVGYNFVSKPFQDDALKNLYATDDAGKLSYASVYNQTGTDYVNLGATNRFTLGLGYHGKHFYADLAYQYQHQSADVYAFHVPADGPTDFETFSGATDVNLLTPQEADLNRHSVLLTLGYKF